MRARRSLATAACCTCSSPPRSGRGCGAHGACPWRPPKPRRLSSAPPPPLFLPPRSGRDLVNMAKKRPNVIPIIEDARHPQKYRMLVPMVDVVFADVAQPDQVGGRGGRGWWQGVCVGWGGGVGSSSGDW